MLIAEIEKYLGTSDHVKERHLTKFDKMPIWMKNDAKIRGNGLMYGNTPRQGLIAIDNLNKTITIIDKQTGLMMSTKHEEKNIVIT